MANIPDFPGYTVSKSGVVKNSSGEVIKPREDRDGYLRVDLMKDGKRYTRFVHSLVEKAFGGVGTEVDHKNKNRKDNRASNLETVSHKENVRRIHKK